MLAVVNLTIGYLRWLVRHHVALALVELERRLHRRRRLFRPAGLVQHLGEVEQRVGVQVRKSVRSASRTASAARAWASSARPSRPRAASPARRASRPAPQVASGAASSLTRQNRSASSVTRLRVERLGEHRGRAWRAGPSRPSPPAPRSRARSLASAAAGPAGEHLHQRLLACGTASVEPAELAEHLVAGATRRRASSKSPAIACSAASGWTCGPRRRAAADLLVDLLAARDRLGHRRRAEQTPPRRASRGSRTAPAGRPPGGRARPRAPSPRRPARACPRPTRAAPAAHRRAALAELVAVRLEHAQRGVRDPSVVLGDGAVTRPGAAPAGVSTRARASSQGHRRERARSPRRAPASASARRPGLEQRRAEPRQQLRRAPGRSCASSAGGALEQAARRGGVAAQERRVGRRGQPLGGRRRQRALALAGLAELGEQAVGLGEVVADRLVAGAGRAPRASAATPLVQLRAPLLGQPLVGGLADQRVREPERVLARQLGAVGADQLLAHERDQVRGDRGAIGLREQLGQRADVEAAALDGR